MKPLRSADIADISFNYAILPQNLHEKAKDTLQPEARLAVRGASDQITGYRAGA